MFYGFIVSENKKTPIVRKHWLLSLLSGLIFRSLPDLSLSNVCILLINGEENETVGRVSDQLISKERNERSVSYTNSSVFLHAQLQTLHFSP